MFSRIFKKIKFLIFCRYKGHNFGIIKYNYSNNAEYTICARCGYKRTRKYKSTSYDDFYIY